MLAGSAAQNTSPHCLLQAVSTSQGPHTMLYYLWLQAPDEGSHDRRAAMSGALPILYSL